ncbi:hypothetical protein K3M67_08640 [Sphingobium sp. V4]|uniref:hypothetical protein n=1 Tax=Sphingobium sp. V4 TaxID=3038927 RepID=UPI0025581B54|nr:hypothetical protein [Sphingobium sp. V4]WIW87070.1 hypothetical protein K3M67_08640 [Sphingobium sp. V4]
MGDHGAVWNAIGIDKAAALEELLAIAMHDGVDIFDSEPVILGEPMAPLAGGNECLVIFVSAFPTRPMPCCKGGGFVEEE